MQNLLHKAREHAFVASVSIAAFTHSSWSLATVFSGHEPPFGLAWLGWIIPAALIAASIDIGLLSLAARIQHRHERTFGRVLSFILLCAGMFALQGLYVASHMPVIALGPGVRADWIPTASLFRDSMLIVVPGLLPLALILHTISGAENSAPVDISAQAETSPIESVRYEGEPPPVSLNELTNAQPPVPESEVVPEPDRPLPPSPNGHRHGESVNHDVTE